MREDDLRRVRRAIYTSYRCCCAAFFRWCSSTAPCARIAAWRHFDQLVFLDVLQAPAPASSSAAGLRMMFSSLAVVRMLVSFLAVRRVDDDVVVAAVLADDLAFVDRLAGLDEHHAALLEVVQGDRR